jgi:hypothetical protein
MITGVGIEALDTAGTLVGKFELCLAWQTDAHNEKQKGQCSKRYENVAKTRKGARQQTGWPAQTAMQTLVIMFEDHWQ